jgi:tRNA modification GTPase
VFSTTDTIVAIATPPGRGGIGVVRLSGRDAHKVARRLITHQGALEPRHATFTLVRLKPDTTYRKPDTTYRNPDTTSRTPDTDSSAVSGFSRTHTDARTDTDAIDQVIATYFPAPASYTGDDVVELSAHGSPVVLRGIVAAAMDGGARLAEPGEFTLRAFLNGRIDLTQAEAVADLVDAVTPLQARAAFDQLQGTLTRAIGEIDAALFDLIAHLEASVDFPEEGYHFADPRALVGSIDLLITRSASLLSGARRGRLVREGFQIAIVGKPNVGKSSLFNALVGASRAIVTDVPGTTRDLVTEVMDLDGVRVTLVDTAGLRATRDIVEVEGVERARRAQGVSDLILVVLDRSHPLDDADRDIVSQTTEYKRLIVENKADLPAAWNSALKEGTQAVSATTGVGLDALRRHIAEALDIEPLTDRPEITNIRHIALVERAYDALVRARAAASPDGDRLSEEFVLADLQQARSALEEVSGRRAPDDLLAHIFSRFCIGK